MTTLYDDIGEAILSAMPDLALGGVASWTKCRPSGDGITATVTVASAGAVTAYVARAAMAKFITAQPSVAVWKSDFLVFAATDVDLLAGDIITDDTLAFRVSVAPITDLGFLLAPADSAELPDLSRPLLKPLRIGTRTGMRL